MAAACVCIIYVGKGKACKTGWYGTWLAGCYAKGSTVRKGGTYETKKGLEDQ